MELKLIEITSTAIAAFKKKLLAKALANTIVRLGVKGGGCVGLSYVIDFHEGAPKKNDKIYNIDGLDVIIDNKSFKLLENVILDYEKDLIGDNFVFQNPNATKRCGCGFSFDIG